jgi:hypothetical protein
MADGLLSNVLGAIDRKKQEVKAGLGLLANNPQEWAAQATARYFPTKEEERQFRMVKEMGGDITQTPYYQKVFDLTQFQGSIKAPNVGAGVSNLPDKTMLQEGKQKFLESSVVKKPMYHGTVSDFTEFLPDSHFGTATAANQRARSWSSQNGERPMQIMPVYLQIKKPLRVLDNEASDEAALLNAIKRGKYPELNLDIANREGANAAVKAAGYDGLVYKNKVEDRNKLSYVVFDPSQVKSAIGNRGTFDVTNPNILAAGLPIGLLGSTQVELPKKQEKKPKK